MAKTKISKTKISALALTILGVFMMQNFLGGYVTLFDTANAATKDASFTVNPNTQTVISGQEFDVDVIVNNTTSQKIITSGFDMTYPKDLLEVVDSDPLTTGVQIDSSSSDFSMIDPALNIVSTTTGKISFTAGTQIQNPLSAKLIALSSIHFKVKDNITTQIANIEIIASSNSDIMVSGINGEPESILKATNGLDSASVVISNVALALSPSSQNVALNEDFTVDLVLNNPDKVGISTLGFEMTYDNTKLSSLNAGSKLNITVDSAKNFQVVENQIKTDGTIVFAGGFTGTTMTDTSLVLGTLSFKASAEGVANVKFNQDPLISSIFTLNDATNNYLGSTVSGVYGIGDNVDTEAPSSEADPDGGTFSEPIRVELSSDDSRADIYYTTDGSDPTDRDDRYRSRILIDKDTTLKFYAVDEAGNEERINRETYRFSQEDFAIGITAIKTDLSTGEQTNMIAKVIDSSIKQPVANKLITISNTGNGLIQAVGGYLTDDEGEVLFQYNAGQSPEIDVVTVVLSENLNVKASLNLSIGKVDLSRIALFGSALDTSKTNYISATVTDANFKRVSPQTPIELKVTKKGTSDTKTYNANTVDGIATFSIPGGDLTTNSTYELVANSNGVVSNTLELSTESTGGSGGTGGGIGLETGGGTTYRPGGRIQPTTGPAENMLVVFLLSVTAVYLYESKKKKQI